MHVKVKHANMQENMHQKGTQNTQRTRKQIQRGAENKNGTEHLSKRVSKPSKMQNK